MRWTDELIEAELRRITAGMTCWPTTAQFAAAHARGLQQTIYTGRGPRWWAARLGLADDRLRAPGRRTPSSEGPAP